MTVNGKPVPDFNTLVDRCCAAGLLQARKDSTKQFRGMRSGEVVLSRVRDRMIRPGEEIDAFAWPVTPQNKQIVDRLKDGLETDEINLSVCFCSVFNECWVRSDEDRRPTPVKQCAVESVPYRQ
jgi:hypothetical protein